MSRSIENAMGSALARLVGAVQRRPAAVLLACLAATALVAAYTATHLGVNADQDAMLSEDLPHRVFEIKYHEHFPVLYENVVVVVDATSSERARVAARALASRMEAAPELFHDVYLPLNPFFEQNALLFLDTDQLQDLADRLARVQPYLSGLAKDGTLRGLTMMLARGLRAAREGDVGGEQLLPMFERLAAALEARLRGEDYTLSWAEIVAQGDLALDPNRRFIIAQPVLDFSNIAAAEKPLEAVKRFARAQGLTEENGVRVRTTGDVALSYEEMELVKGQAATAGLASFVAVAALLFLALRSARLVLATTFTLVIGLIWTAGFAAAAIGHLNLISVAFAVLFIGLGVDFGVHLCLRYQELLGQGREHAVALTETARGVGGSLVLCSLTTSIGFYAFVPTDFSGVAELGLISGTGMFVSLACTFTVLPALMSLRLRRAPLGSEGRGLPLPHFPLRHPRAVVAGALALGIAAIALLPRAHFDQNPLRVRDPSAESVKTFEELLSDPNASPWSLNAVAPDLASAEALAAELRALPSVGRVTTLRDYIPEEQQQKLEIIEDVALLLPPLELDGEESRPSAAEQIEALRGLEHALEVFLRSEPSRALRKGAEDVHTALASFLARVEASDEGEALLEELEESLVGSLPDQLAMLERTLRPHPITLESLPAGLLERMVSDGGNARVQIFPAEDLQDDAALERFVTEVRGVTPDVAGSAVNIYEASRAVVRALRQALVAAVVVIARLLLLLWRTVGDTALVLAPLALAAILTGAVAVLLGIPFNFADVIVLPLLLGIGVDSGIHLVHRARLHLDAGDQLLDTSTARAVVVSALTTIASFGTLAFATHLGMASLGQLLTIGVTLTVLCNLIFLPALLTLRRQRASARRDVAERARS